MHINNNDNIHHIIHNSEKYNFAITKVYFLNLNVYI